jgi:hypothetical protein
MKKILFCLIVSCLSAIAASVQASEFDDLNRIMEAAQLNNKDIQGLSFPPQKQLFSTVAEEFSHLTGEPTVHYYVADLKHADKKLTCWAKIIQMEEAVYAGVSNCQETYPNYLGNDVFIPMTQVQ